MFSIVFKVIEDKGLYLVLLIHLIPSGRNRRNVLDGGKKYCFNQAGT